MGNSSTSALKVRGVDDVSSPHVVQKLKLLDIDPRSPTDGIVRTPIILEKASNNEGLKSIAGPLPFDTSDFESIDGCLTEDDSLQPVRNNSALSENPVNSNALSSEGPRSNAFLARVRRSLASQVRNSPSFFVKMRQKQKFEERQQHEQANLACQVDTSVCSNGDLHEPDNSFTVGS